MSCRNQAERVRRRGIGMPPVPAGVLSSSPRAGIGRARYSGVPGISRVGVSLVKLLYHGRNDG
ncbi:hypothetical protein AZA_46066 [Nitrospirillum viridazoti Y2]|nr:hypothetical protein AZA_46066 [Nitrospirillum amazonense Y2]